MCLRLCAEWSTVDIPSSSSVHIRQCLSVHTNPMQTKQFGNITWSSEWDVLLAKRTEWRPTVDPKAVTCKTGCVAACSRSQACHLQDRLCRCLQSIQSLSLARQAVSLPAVDPKPVTCKTGCVAACSRSQACHLQDRLCRCLQ